MPYIKNENGRREELRAGIPAKIAGELNYQIFTHVKYDGFDSDTVKTYIKNFLGDKPNYQKYNDMVGAVCLCFHEIERRLNIELWEDFAEEFEKYIDTIDKYEDVKIEENGDV